MRNIYYLVFVIYLFPHAANANQFIEIAPGESVELLGLSDLTNTGDSEKVIVVRYISNHFGRETFSQMEKEALKLWPKVFAIVEKSGYRNAILRSYSSNKPKTKIETWQFYNFLWVKRNNEWRLHKN